MMTAFQDRLCLVIHKLQVFKKALYQADRWTIMNDSKASLFKFVVFKNLAGNS